MAKKFLEQLTDAYEEDFLADLIPPGTNRRKIRDHGIKRSAEQKNIVEPKRKASNTSRRKKLFIGRIGEALGEVTDKDQLALFKNENKRIPKMEETLDDETLDLLFPTPELRKKKVDRGEDSVSINTMITRRVLKRAREIAHQKGMRVKDVINIALERYLESQE